jgi:hypothetical protein
MKRCLTGLLIVASAAALVPAQTQGSAEERLRSLEQQNQSILERLRASEARNRDLETKITVLEDETHQLRVEETDAALENHIDALLAETDASWIHATKSGKAIRFYGFFRLDAYYNSARANSVIVPAWVLPENDVTAEPNDDQFALDTRLTRFGIDVDAGRIGSADVTGKLEIDFANFPAGVPESRETPRIRVAYMNIDFGDWTIRMGQDWDVISPLFPSANNELLMWFAGNLGDRRPQMQLRYESGDPKDFQFSFILSAGLTGAIDNGDLDAGLGTFTSSERDGFDSGHPHGQLRAGIQFGSWVPEQTANIGLWGYIAGLETDTEFAGDDHFTPWTIGIDLTLPLFGPLTWRGEVWYGQALSDVRGTIGQVINPGTGDEIQGWGGWTEFVWQVNDSFSLALGGSIDDPDNDDVPGGGRNLNWTVYIASVYKWGGGLKSGLDVIYWETDWDTLGIGNMIRVNFYTQLDF